MADYDAGRVFLSVVPSFRNVQRLIGAEAKKWGRDAGKDFQQGFDREVGQRTTKQSPGPSTTQSRRQGVDAGGAFADAFRKRIEAATRALPPVRIGVATNEIDQKLRDLRLDLERLSGQTVGVDLDTAAAMAEISRIDGELNRLGADSASVQVRADVGAASAQLAAIHAQVNSLDRDDVNIDVDVRGGGASLGLLAANGAAASRNLSGIATTAALLGPVIIPVAGAAAAAVAGIGGAAVAAASGLGVLVLGFSGIGDAVKALGEVQTNAGRDAEAAAARQASSAASVASAQRSVTSAEAELTNARANAASAAEDAARRIAEAQQDLIDVQRDAAEAVEDAHRRIDDATEGLARAQEQAAEAAEDAARRVEDAQRGVEEAVAAAAEAAEDAAERIIDAQERLEDAIEDAGRANEQAAERVADAQQRMADVAEDGSRRVVDALDRQEIAERSLVDAQEDALDAQQSLNEARQAAQDDAEDLALAVRQGAIDEQQAIIAVEEARRRLEKLGGPSDVSVDQRFTGELVLNDQTEAVTDQAREEARLALQEAELGLDRIRLGNERLAEEQAEAALKGVEGSARVVDAKGRLEDATLRVVDAEEDVRDAVEDTARARRQETRNNADAQRDLDDAIENRTRVEEESAERVVDANKALDEAVQARIETQEDGADRIAAAERRLADAQEARRRTERDAARQVADATQAVADAQGALADAQEDGADRVIDAQGSVAAAVVASGEQQRQSAASVESAQRSLEGAQASLALALQNTGDQGSASMRKLEDAMLALSPAGVAFANFLHGLRPVFDQFRTAAQEGLLPGVQAGIEALLTRKPEILAFVGDIAGVMGDIARRAGEALAGPAWENFFDYLARTAGPTLLTLADAFGDIALGIANLITEFEPVQDMFISGLSNMAESFREWSEGLAENAGFQKFLDYLQDVGPQVMDTLGALFDALFNIAEGLAPIGGVILDVIEFVADFIAGLDPGVITAFATALIAFVVGFQTVTAIVALAAVPLAGTIGLIAAAVALVVLGLVKLYNESETFRDIVGAAWDAVSGAVKFAWERVIQPAFAALATFVTGTLAPVVTSLWYDTVQPAFAAIGSIIKDTWERVLSPALTALWAFTTNTLIPTIEWLWHNVVAPAFAAIGAIIEFAWRNVIQPAFAALDTLVRDVLGPTVSWLWRNIVEPAFSAIGQIITGSWDVIRPLLTAFSGFIRDDLGPTATWLWRNIIQPAFEGATSAISTAWNTIKPILQSLGDFITDTVAPAFSEGVDAIGTAFDRIRALAAQPINFVVQTVYGEGIKPIFDKIADVVGLSGLPATPAPIRFASGGVMPGYTPGRDVHKFYSPTAGMLELSGGEPILRPEAGRVLGRSWVDGINSAARRGGTGGVKRYLGGYADGGILSFAGGGFFDRATDRLGDLASMAKEGVQSALSAAGRFVLGGLKKAAELALRPIRSSIANIGGGRLGDVAGGLANRAIDGILGFAGKKDQAALTLEGGAFSRDRTGWPARIFGRVAANTAAAVRFVRDTFGIGSIGTLGNRANRSDHPFGKAFDAMIANWRTSSGIAKGNQIANWFTANPGVFGTKYVIWRDRINSGSGWRPYVHPSGNTTNPTLRHMDHVHASLFDSGGRLQPGITQVMNATGASELVLNQSQEGALAQTLRDLRGRVATQQALADIRVFVGDREIRDIVGVEINGQAQMLRQLGRAAGRPKVGV